METVTMSYEELHRAGVIQRVIEKRLSQREAATMLGLTTARCGGCAVPSNAKGLQACGRSIAVGPAIDGCRPRCAERRCHHPLAVRRIRPSPPSEA
jgi:hypothetical protein